MTSMLARFVTEPASDYMSALERSLPREQRNNALLIGVCVAAAWWLYVPLHELLHAAGCMAAGGSVSKLEIDARYGARVLALVFPFVSAGSEYAGRLSGFDTRGSDFIYFATDFAPFLLTVLLGVPLLRRAAHGSLAPRTNAVLFGLSLPFAYAPVLSVFGDYYEMGSILVTRVMRAREPSFDVARLRGDDVTKVLDGIAEAGNSTHDLAGFAASLATGIVLALATLWLGRVVSRAFPTSA